MNKLENLGSELFQQQTELKIFEWNSIKMKNIKTFFFLKKSFKKKMIGFLKLNPIYATWHTF